VLRIPLIVLFEGIFALQGATDLTMEVLPIDE
jgi:hypothetical protein